MAIVYKITNVKDGQMYVGTTIKTLKKRWSSHKTSAKTVLSSKTPILEAIRNCGENSFLVEVIEECEDKERYERERFWIKELETVESGYNIISGCSKFNHEEIVKLLIETGSAYQAAKIANCSTSHAWKVAQENNIKIKESPQTMKRKIKAILKDDSEVEFDSICDGAKYCMENCTVYTKNKKVVETGIRKVCRGKNKRIYGITWEYENEMEGRM